MVDLVQQIRDFARLRPVVASSLSPLAVESVNAWIESARAALLAVIDRHKPESESAGGRVSYYCASCRDTGWTGPGVDWPCETVEDIAKSLGIEVSDG